MDLDASSLLTSFLVSGIGFVAFTYGTRQKRAPQIIVGLVLMVFPYFVSNVFAMLGITVALLVGLWLAVRSGF